MPPFDVVAAALRKTTEGLAREVVQPSATAPDWSELDWAIARASAAMQGTSALLANRLRWTGPSIWTSFLAENLEQARLRDAAIGSLLQRIDEALRAEGLGAVALKGSALRRLGIYAPGERPMGDIDLLMRPEDIAATESVLGRLDYVLAGAIRRHVVFEPRIKPAAVHFSEHIDNPLKIEVHPAITEPLPVSSVEITGLLLPRDAPAGLSFYPGAPELMLHLLHHAAGGMCTHTVRQIQIHDIAALSRQLRDTDWHSILIDPESRKRRWWLFPPLALTARYYGGAIPPEVLREARSTCPLLLRLASRKKSLTDVSWSNLRIYALPGVAWARTPIEVLRLIRHRLLPRRADLAKVRLALELQPKLNQFRWYNVSQFNRILRWILTRPPRVQAMVSVKAALDSAERFRASSAPQL